MFGTIVQCAAALFDQHVPAERALREPQLYQYTLHARSYRMWSYWVNVFDAIWQSTVIFFISYFAYRHEENIDGASFGFAVIFAMTATSLLHVLIQTSRVGLSVISSIVLSFLVFIGFTLVFDAACVNCMAGESPYYVSYKTLRQARFWLSTSLCIVVAMLPRYAIRCFYSAMRSPLK